MIKILIALLSLGGSVILLIYAITEYTSPGPILLGIALLLLSIVFFALFFYSILRRKIHRLENRLEVWSDISPHISKAGDEAFQNLPIGIIVFDNDHIIMWANDFIRNALKANFLERHVDVLRDELSLTLQNKIPTFQIRREDKTFDVIHNVENRILYFFDQTEKTELFKKYNDNITAIAIISIDNLDDALKKFDLSDAASVKGQLLEIIADWASEHDAYLENQIDERILLFFNRKSLDKMMERNFDVLTKVKELTAKYLIRISMSVGIACYDTSYEEVGRIAQSAIELAEKRGGDQVVVNIENEKIKFYGGLTDAVEKNTLIQARINAIELKDIVQRASNVYITCHNLADCDALGSSLGMLKMVDSSHDDVKIIFDSSRSDIAVRRFWDMAKDTQPKLLNYFVLPQDVRAREDSLLIVVDTPSPSMMMFPEVLDKIKNVVIVDHHRMGENPFKDPLLQYIETYASSTVELVTEMIMFYGNEIKFTPFEASILLSGLVVDTNNFKFRTGARTFEVAALLKSKGADSNIVKSFLRDSLEVEQELATAMLGAQTYFNRFAVYSCPEDKYLQDRTMLARISDRMLEIDNIDATFSIAKVKNEDVVAVSARSIHKVNVQIIMEEMGGGGHFNSAAVQIKNKSVKEVTEELVELLEREYGHSEDDKMKVILLQDVKGKGKKDDIVDVTTGYANYLMTNKLAVNADKENLKSLENNLEKAKEETLRRKQLMQKLKSDIEVNEVDIHIKLGADKKVLGTITSKNIADEFEKQNGILIDKRKIQMPAQINAVGIYTATINLHEDVIANIKINVLEK